MIMAATVTIDKAYFETLLRRYADEFNDRTPDGQIILTFTVVLNLSVTTL